MHKAGFIYDDLKPDNMMMGPPPKVIDLGECIDITKQYDNSKIMASAGYTPNEADNTQASDVHKMGLCVAQTLLGEFGNEFIESLKDKLATERTIARNIQEKFGFKPGKKGEYIKQLYNALPGLLKDEQFKEYIPSCYSDAQLEFLGNLIKDCINPELMQRPTSEQMLAIFEQFSAEPNAPVPSYENVKAQAIKDHPKDLPPVLMAKLFSKDKKEMDQAFTALKQLVKDDPSYVKTPTYGLAMLRHDQKKITKEPKYEQWKSENKTINADLLDRVCLEGMEFQDGKGIPLTLDKMKLLKEANKDTEETDQDFKTRPMYGLYLFKKGEIEKFQKWTKAEGKNEKNETIVVDSAPFIKLQERICLEGISNQDGKGINLSADDILNLSEFDDGIKNTPAYGLALFKKGEIEKFQTWATKTEENGSLTDSDPFTELQERICLEGTSHYTGKGIGLSVDDIIKLSAYDVGIKSTTTYKLAKALNDQNIQLTSGKELEELRERAYIAGSSNPPENGIAVPAEVYTEINYFSFDEAKELVGKVGNDNKLGEGSFGTIYKVKGKDGKTYAVKIAKSTNDNAKNDFKLEKEVNEYLKANLSEEERKYFVDYYGGFEIDGKYVLITEFIDKPEEEKHADFNKFINDIHAGNGCSKEDFPIMTMLLQQGWERLAIEQRKGLLNRDIKPDNMMVAKDTNGVFQLKGTDYGTACTYTGIGDVITKGIGTPSYMSPEILTKENYSFASDVYSMGISLLEGLCGGVFPKSEFKFPWKIAEYVSSGKLSEDLADRTFDKLVESKVITQKQFNTLKENLDNDEQKIGFLASLVADCTAFNPKERITAKQAAYLLRKFNDGNDGNYNYNAIRSEAIRNYPKAIPDPIKDMISSSDSEIREQGMEALKNLIREDPSYIHTETFKNLDELVTTAVKTRVIEDIMVRISSTDMTVKQTGIVRLKNLIREDPSYIETETFKNLPKDVVAEIKKPSNYELVLSRLQNGEQKDNGLVTEKSVPNPETGNETYEIDFQVGNSDDKEEYEVNGAVVDFSDDTPDDVEDQENVPISQSTGLNIDLDNEFASGAIMQELELILSDNFDALSKAQDFILNSNHDVRKLNEFLIFVQENTHTPEEINAKADELFKA